MTSGHIPASSGQPGKPDSQALTTKPLQAEAAAPATPTTGSARTALAQVTSAVRSATCPLCDAAAPRPCQAWPPADHLSRWLAAEAAKRITRADLTAAIGGLDVIAAQALVAERSPTTTRTTRGTLTIAEICADLGISRRTFYEWRAKNKAPRCIHLPNGSLRVRRTEYQRWLQTREDTA